MLAQLSRSYNRNHIFIATDGDIELTQEQRQLTCSAHEINKWISFLLIDPFSSFNEKFSNFFEIFDEFLVTWLLFVRLPLVVEEYSDWPFRTDPYMTRSCKNAGAVQNGFSKDRQEDVFSNYCPRCLLVNLNLRWQSDQPRSLVDTFWLTARKFLRMVLRRVIWFKKWADHSILR